MGLVRIARAPEGGTGEAACGPAPTDARLTRRAGVAGYPRKSRIAEPSAIPVVKTTAKCGSEVGACHRPLWAARSQPDPLGLAGLGDPVAIEVGQVPLPQCIGVKPDGRGIEWPTSHGEGLGSEGAPLHRVGGERVDGLELAENRARSESVRGSVAKSSALA